MNRRKNIGPLGEELVVRFLMKRGYAILDRNFSRKWGELDIVAEQGGKIHFVEVKAMKRRRVPESVSVETHDVFRPEDHVHSDKLKRLGRIVQTYLLKKHVSDETPWQFDVATVLIDERNKQVKVELLEDLIL
ncbi:MAG: YraN family protein [bacterium]|nr:YraN family protein [bacterium]